MDYLTEQEIKDLIVKFNLDETINDLKRYYSTPTTWEIINQSRKETCHTQFLAWFFGNKDFNADPNMGPAKKLIVLLLKWANKQDGVYFDEELANSIYSQGFSILSCPVVKSEYPISIQRASADNPVYGDGNIDIFITCKAKVNDEERNVNIVIENKINSPETTKCFDKDGKIQKRRNKEDAEITLFQTEAYYQYITEKYKKDINLYVFLKPTINMEDIKSSGCKCDKYVKINYQELLDNILQPVCEQKDIAAENMFRLKEYIRALGKSSEIGDKADNNSSKSIIMAMEQKERNLLTDFFLNNEDLIRAAIEAYCDGEITKNLSDELSRMLIDFFKNNKDLICTAVEVSGDKELSGKLTSGLGKRHTRNSYTINKSGNYSMYEVLEKFVEFRLSGSPSASVGDINKEINSYINSKRVNVSDTQCFKVFRQGKRPHGVCPFNSRDGQEIRYTKQWGDGRSDTTFTRFREGVSREYPNFQIDIV